MLKYLAGMMLVGLLGILSLHTIKQSRPKAGPPAMQFASALPSAPIQRQFVEPRHEVPASPSQQLKAAKTPKTKAAGIADSSSRGYESATLITEDEMKDYLDQFSAELDNLTEIWNDSKEDFYKTKLGISDSDLNQIRQINTAYQRRHNLITEKLGNAPTQETRDDMIRHLVAAEDMYVIEVESIIGFSGIDKFMAFRERFNRDSREQQATDAAVTGF